MQGDLFVLCLQPQQSVEDASCSYVAHFPELNKKYEQISDGEISKPILRF